MTSQHAREAAADYLPSADEECGELERGLMRAGEMDDHWLVQAFARFEAEVEARTLDRAADALPVEVVYTGAQETASEYKNRARMAIAALKGPER